MGYRKLHYRTKITQRTIIGTEEIITNVGVLRNTKESQQKFM